MTETVVTSPDPTKNVLDLVDAAISRLDDLRAAESRRIDESISAEARRVDQSFDFQRREADLRAAYDEKLRAAEANRLDANRAVDVAAVGTANERAVAQASVLAAQVVTSAEALRIAFAATTSQLAENIAALQRTSYEGAGRSTVNDPAMLRMVTAMEMMQSKLENTSGRGQGMQALWGWIVAAVVAGAAAAKLFS